MIIDSFEVFISRLNNDKTFTHYGLDKTFKVRKVDVDKDILLVFDPQTFQERDFPLRGIYENHLFKDAELCNLKEENACAKCFHKDDCKDSKSNRLPDNLEEIRRILENRNIKYLIHFTSRQNIESIRINGLLSRKKLEEHNIKALITDPERFDKKLDFISLSITKENFYMLKNKENAGTLVDPWIILIDAKILYEDENAGKALFYNCNAATTSSPHLNYGSTYQDLEKMFNDTFYRKKTELELIDAMFNEKPEEYSNFKLMHRDINKKSNETTDVQAEILFPGIVKTKYIIKCIPYSKFKIMEF